MTSDNETDSQPSENILNSPELSGQKEEPRELNDARELSNTTDEDCGSPVKAPSDENEKSERFEGQRINILYDNFIDQIRIGKVVIEGHTGPDSKEIFEDLPELTEHFDFAPELKSQIAIYQKTLLEQNILVINCLDEELRDTVCAHVLRAPAFSSARKKAFYKSKWEDDVPNAIAPFMRLFKGEKSTSKKPLVLCYFERADSVPTSLLLSLAGEELARKGNTAKLKELNTYIVYVLQSSLQEGTPGKLPRKKPSFLWSLHFYPHLLHKYTQDFKLVGTMQTYFDRVLDQNEELRANDRVFYEYFTKLQEHSHPESFYLTRESVAIQTIKALPDELNAILESSLCQAVIYIQCYLPSLPLREYDSVLAVLLPVHSGESEYPYLHVLSGWKNNPDKILDKCKLVARKNEDGSRRLEFGSSMLRENFRALLEEKYAMSIEKLTRNLLDTLLLFTAAHSSELHRGLVQLFKESVLREEKSVRARELHRRLQAWDSALKTTDPAGLSVHSKMVARLLAEFMIEASLVPVVHEVLVRFAEEPATHFMLLETLFTLSRWFDIVNASWIRIMVDSEVSLISKKAIRLIYHNTRVNNLSIAQVITTYSAWLPDESERNYSPSEQFALGLFTELIDDTEVDSSQCGHWPPHVSVFKECTDNYRQTIDSICKIILHPGVLLELQKHLEINREIGQEAHGQAIVLDRFGLCHPQRAYLRVEGERKKTMTVVAEILYAWKISELLICWSVLLQGSSSTRMHPKARIVRDELLRDIAKKSSPGFRENLLTAWTVAEKIKYDPSISPLQIREVRMQFQYFVINLSKKI